MENEKEFFKIINSLNSTIADDKKIKAEQLDMMKKYAKDYQCLLQPYRFRIDKGLYTRGVHLLLTKRKKMVS